MQIRSTGPLVLATMLLTAVSGCGSATPTQTAPASQPAAESSAPGENSGGTPAPSQQPSSPFALELNVADNARDVPVDTLITATAKSGKVDDVKVTTSATGQYAVTNITGSLDDQGVWHASSRLDPGASYTVTATGTGADGAQQTKKVSFRTVNLAKSKEVFPTLTPVQGGPFGVAQPVVLQFDHAVANKAEFERNLHLTSAPAQEGSWGWVSDTEVHYRPKEYWQPGTQLTLDANLNGVDAGNGNFGQTSRQLKLAIGRKQLQKVDIPRHTISLETEGKPSVSYPMSAGKGGEFTTRSGTKVIMEKAEGIKMESETTGIDRNSSEGYSVKVAYALRVTSSGEFIHSAPWNAGAFGKRNASHGCVGMDTEDAYSLFERTQVGDPVEFTGTDRKVELGNGWSEWNLSWDKWKERSALH